MPKASLRILCLVTAVLCIVQRSLEHGIPRRSFLSRRAIDGTRGRKYFDPHEDGAFDSYGSAGGQYDPYDRITDLSDIRKNVPGEPGIDYPAYTTLPQTGFTCEGRSRGYYADEAAGCQVFHVCHDVLVSSFLCPIGSTFSQKLLTCDWWTKVDCSSTRRYLEVNRDSYQIDDDEMIRNAYAMISLQASAEDVTKDGLVDPDSGARIIDYSVLGGRTVIGYTPGFRRITDYAPVEATGNDLPSGFEDYSQQNARQILNYDHRYQQKKADSVYQGKLHFESKGRSPYHASAVIQHDYQDRSGDNEYQDDYRRPDGYTNGLQTSYAPTVPTVTTTTRRFYSPTVPTTYRPSTLAYSKLDLMVESSDHLYAHTKGSVTPPTVTHRNDDMRKIDLRESETGRDDLKKSENASSSRTDKDGQKADDVRSRNDELRSEGTSETSFRINVTDMIDEDEVFRQQNDRPIIQIDNEDGTEDGLETKDSIGIAHALNDPLGRIIVQNQNPVYQMSKDERRGSSTPIPQTILNHSSEFYEKANASYSPTKTSSVLNETSNDRSTEDYEDISSSTTRSFSDRTTPLLNNGELRDVDAAQTSTASMTATPATDTERNGEINGEITVRTLSKDNRTAEDQNSSPTEPVSGFNDKSKLNLNLEVPQPAQFLQPPVERFLINVPDETRYTTIDGNSRTSWSPRTTTTEAPRFSSTFAGISEDRSTIYDELIDYTDEGFSETPSPGGVDSTVQVAAEVSTSIPWLVSTWHDRSIVNVPVTDLVPPFVDYDGFGEVLVPPDERSYADQFDHTEPPDSRRTQNSPTTPTSSKKNDSEADVLARYNTGFHFTIRDAIKAQKESKANFGCHSSTSDNRQGSRCETSFVASKIAASTPSVTERTVSIGTTTRFPEQVTFSGSTRSLKLPEESMTSVPRESLTSTAKSPIKSDVDTKDSNQKTVTPRAVLEIKNPEGKTERTVDVTVSSLLRSTRPGSLKQITETIDKHESPYEVSFAVKKDEDLATTADDFISRLVAQHEQPDTALKGELGDFEIIKSVEPETDISSVLQAPKLPDASHVSPADSANNDSFYIAENDTAAEFKQLDSNMSMVNLLQLMAELLKLDRLPRPFTTKDLDNIELRDSFNLDLEESSYDTASPPLNYPQTTKTTYNNANFKASTFDTITLRTPFKFAESTASRNLRFPKPSFATESPLVGHSQTRASFGNTDSEISSLDDTSKTPINDLIDLKPPEVSARVNNTTEQKTKPESRISRGPLQKEEILEQLKENLGQPLYRGDSIHRPLVFDLPQVQRSLNFETGLPLKKREHVISEEGSATSTTRPTTTTTTTTTQEATTTTESVKTTVETEFVPSLGFSLDTNEGREEYVQAVLEGLIDEQTTNESGRNESSNAQNEASKNETLEADQ